MHPKINENDHYTLLPSGMKWKPMRICLHLQDQVTIIKAALDRDPECQQQWFMKIYTGFCKCVLFIPCHSYPTALIDHFVHDFNIAEKLQSAAPSTSSTTMKNSSATELSLQLIDPTKGWCWKSWHQCGEIIGNHWLYRHDNQWAYT